MKEITIPEELAETNKDAISESNSRTAEARLVKYAVKALAQSQEKHGVLFSKSGADTNEDIIHIIKDLQNSGIDIQTIDVLLTSEVNRKLKKQFAWVFATFALFSLISSYMIVALNSPLNLGIAAATMTALIIEAPIQFIGILYIVAKNLFPDDKK